MRRRLLVLGLAAVAAASSAPSASAALEYTRQCTANGKRPVDTMCYHDYCGIVSCTRYDCHVWFGTVDGDPNTAVCIGQPRPPM